MCVRFTWPEPLCPAAPNSDSSAPRASRTLGRLSRVLRGEAVHVHADLGCGVDGRATDEAAAGLAGLTPRRPLVSVALPCRGAQGLRATPP
jgi:hypothetical protein